MITHSAEYYHALKAEMLQLHSLLNQKTYSTDIPFVMDGINKEIRVCDIALSSVNCEHCLHCIKPENRCGVLGSFPENLDKKNYSCPNWVFDGIPF